MDSSDSSVKLKSAVFGVYRASDDTKVAELTTDDKGVATSEDLPLDVYYLREISAPDGYMLSSDRHLVQLNKADETLEITVKNEKKTSDTGKLKIIKTDAGGKVLQGAVFTLYDSSGKQIAELVTGADGTAMSGDLPVGDYYLIEKTPPAGYKPITEKITFTIQAEKTYEAKVVNQPLKLPKGTVEVFFKHIQHKHELAKAQSYTDDVGKEYLPWIQKNGYDGMPIKGYHFVKTDYPASKVLIEGKLIVTVWYDDAEDVPGGAADGQGGNGSGSGSGTTKLPKTGEPFPWANYALGALCLCLAGMMGFALTRTRKDSIHVTAE